MMLDPVVGLLLIGSFTMLFASAAVHKWRDLPAFVAAFHAYALLPRDSPPRAAWAVPLLESAVALGLLAAVSRAYAAVGGIGLLLSYAGAIVLNLRRGRRDIACGCGGPDQRRPIAAWMAWRNLALALLLAAALRPWSTRALQWTDRVTIGCGIAAAAVVYLCFDRLAQLSQRERSVQATS